MKHIKVLESFGISNKEAEILYSCMHSKGASASEISKKTGIERTNVYKILERLISFGLVITYKQDKVTRYRSLEPQKLLELLKNDVENFKKNIEEFEQLYSNVANFPKIELFTGRKAIRNVISSVISENQQYCAFGGIEEAYKQNYLENISSGLLAQEQKILGRIILSPKEKTLILSNEKYRVAPTPLPSNVCTIINNEMIVILNWGYYCSAIVITDKKIANDYLTLFENLWIQAKKISHKELLTLELKNIDFNFEK